MVARNAPLLSCALHRVAHHLHYQVLQCAHTEFAGIRRSAIGVLHSAPAVTVTPRYRMRVHQASSLLLHPPLNTRPRMPGVSSC